MWCLVVDTIQAHIMNIKLRIYWTQFASLSHDLTPHSCNSPTLCAVYICWSRYIIYTVSVMLCSLLCPQDLSRLGRDIRKVVIIDNSPQSYIFHPDNAVSDRQARSIASVYVRVCKNAHVRFYTPPPLHLCMFEYVWVCKNAHVRFYTPPPLHLCMFEYVRTRMSGFTHHRHYICVCLSMFEYVRTRMSGFTHHRHYICVCLSM